jgi:hypothetical protein
LYVIPSDAGNPYGSAPRAWLIFLYGTISYEYLRENYERDGNLLLVGLVQFIDPVKREFKDKSKPTIKGKDFHFQVEDGVYGDIELSDQLIGEVKVSLKRGEESEDENN